MKNDIQIFFSSQRNFQLINFNLIKLIKELFIKKGVYGFRPHRKEFFKRKEFKMKTEINLIDTIKKWPIQQLNQPLTLNLQLQLIKRRKSNYESNQSRMSLITNKIT